MDIDPRFTEDFLTYWGMLSFLLGATGRTFGADFDRHRMDGLSRGLRATYLENWHRTPGVLRRLKRTKVAYAAAFRGVDLLLTPVLAHPAPEIGHLAPTVPYARLIERILAYVAFTPVDNVVGTPSISLPGPRATAGGLPVGVMFSGRPGSERTLLDVAFTLEAERPFRRIQDA